ncbi:MAG: DegT/DnrJ/EryC1/StrS family aminotransferase [Acidimicrobiales bacterium]
MIGVVMAPEGEVQLPSDQGASGRSFGDEELALLEEVVRSGVLTATRGDKARTLAAEFAALVGARFAVPCSSGTAAVHAAVAAIDPEPGDEVITTSITDMGALAPIIYQGAIPVFADVDPATGNVTAATIEARLSGRTRAIIVTHLFGNPCAMDEIMALSRATGVPVIEDTAQAYLASSGGATLGTIGAIGCFSLQQGKHMTSGEGGLVVTDDEALARRTRLSVDKAWGYGEPDPDHEFLALNYRMSELQGAVALAQLRKLPRAVSHRVAMAERLSDQIAGIAGVRAPAVRPGDRHVYWRYVVSVDPDAVPGGPVALAGALRSYDVASAPRYIQKPAYKCAVFQEQRTFGRSRFPFTLARPEAIDWSDQRFPGTLAALAGMLVLPFNERYEDHHVDYLARALAGAVEQVQGGAA